MADFDYAVIGGGIAGISAAAELARSHRVLLLEREPHLAYHTTGRSAAIYSETYGNRAIRALTSASRSFFESPPEGFTAQPLLRPRAWPCDAQPEELDVALCVDRLELALDLPIARIERSWAGLRTFVPDRTPAVGFDPRVPGFFWLAGQGGYGIQTSPALARVVAALARGERIPSELLDFGVDVSALDPARLRQLQV